MGNGIFESEKKNQKIGGTYPLTPLPIEGSPFFGAKTLGKRSTCCLDLRLFIENYEVFQLIFLIMVVPHASMYTGLKHSQRSVRRFRILPMSVPYLIPILGTQPLDLK